MLRFYYISTNLQSDLLGNISPTFHVFIKLPLNRYKDICLLFRLLYFSKFIKDILELCSAVISLRSRILAFGNISDCVP